MQRERVRDDVVQPAELDPLEALHLWGETRVQKIRFSAAHGASMVGSKLRLTYAGAGCAGMGRAPLRAHLAPGGNAVELHTREREQCAGHVPQIHRPLVPGIQAKERRRHFHGHGGEGCEGARVAERDPKLLTAASFVSSWVLKARGRLCTQRNARAARACRHNKSRAAGCLIFRCQAVAGLACGLRAATLTAIAPPIECPSSTTCSTARRRH